MPAAKAGASALGAGVFTAAAEIATTAAATAGAAGIEVVATALAAAIAAILPAPGSGAALAATAAAAASTGITTASSTAIAATAAAVATASTGAITTAAAIATGAATAAGATATSTAATGFGLVDAQGTTHQLNPLQGIDGLGLQLGIRHLDEGEAALATGVPLQRQGAVRHLSKGGEELENVFLLGAEGQITDENTH